jgi:class 3 adenylate cyclase
MTRPSSELKIENKIVLVTDISSSTEIMEDLLRTESMLRWRNLLINIKKELVRTSEDLDFEIYKFTGDGWLLFFEPDYDVLRILRFLRKLSSNYESEFNDRILPYLESPPDITGLTFGMDIGSLVKIIMMGNEEYVGRPINLACRLQGAIEETDILCGYRVIISNRLYHIVGDSLVKFHPELITRRLKNIIRGSEFQCYRLSISKVPFKINKALYAGKNNSVDVTQELTSQIKRGCIDIVVTNQLLGGDPEPGSKKSLNVEYVFNNEVFNRKVKEKARLQLP